MGVMDKPVSASPKPRKVPRKCRFCKEKPYATEEEYRNDVKAYAEKRADSSKEGAAAFARAHEAGQHGGGRPQRVVGAWQADGHLAITTKMELNEERAQRSCVALMSRSSLLVVTYRGTHALARSLEIDNKTR